MAGMNRWLRHIMQITVLVLALAGCVPMQANTCPAAAPMQSCTLDATHDDIPTWENLGLEDLLAPATECSMAAPQSVPAHSGGAATHCCTHFASLLSIPVTRQLHPQPRRTCRSNDYYLYFLYRLRL